MKKALVVILMIVVASYGITNVDTTEIEHFTDIFAQFELVAALVLTVVIGAVTALHNYFTSGKGLTFIISFIAGKIYSLMNSDDEQGKERFMQTVDTILDQSVIKNIIHKIDKTSAEKLATLKHDLVDIQMKLKHTDDDLMKAKLLDAKKAIEDAINEISA